MTWYLIGAIFLVGIWGIIAQRNLIKKILGLSIANSAIIMFFIYFGSLSGTGAPIVGDEGLAVERAPAVDVEVRDDLDQLALDDVHRHLQL